jgi:hypothetical protein
LYSPGKVRCTGYEARGRIPARHEFKVFPEPPFSRALDHTTGLRRRCRRRCYVKTFQIAHATMTTNAAPATKSPTGRAAVLHEVIGASPLLCLISRISKMRIVREKVSSC